MDWDVQFFDTFDTEFEDLQEAVQDELLAQVYKQLIKKADERFDDHLSQIAKKGRK